MKLQIEFDTTRCPVCGKEMIPRWYRNIQNIIGEPMAKAGLVMESYILMNGNHICQECESEGKAFFVCAICHKIRPTSDIERSFGDPPESICKHCYTSETAKVNLYLLLRNERNDQNQKRNERNDQNQNRSR